MFDHDEFYTECNKRFKRKELQDSIIFGVITFAVSIAALYLLLAIFNPDVYLCR